MPVHNEAEMLMSLHEAQMQAKNIEQALYYRMHKEMSPVLIRIINETFDAGGDREAFLDRIETVIIAYGQYIASSISAVSVLLGGEGDDRMENRHRIADVINDLATDYLKMFLEKEEKQIMSKTSDRPETP